jgi:hypothetical protein
MKGKLKSETEVKTEIRNETVGKLEMII